MEFDNNGNKISLEKIPEENMELQTDVNKEKELEQKLPGENIDRAKINKMAAVAMVIIAAVIALIIGLAVMIAKSISEGGASAWKKESDSTSASSSVYVDEQSATQQETYSGAVLSSDENSDISGINWIETKMCAESGNYDNVISFLFPQDGAHFYDDGVFFSEHRNFYDFSDTFGLSFYNNRLHVNNLELSVAAGIPIYKYQDVLDNISNDDFSHDIANQMCQAAGAAISSEYPQWSYEVTDLKGNMKLFVINTKIIGFCEKLEIRAVTSAVSDESTYGADALVTSIILDNEDFYNDPHSISYYENIMDYMLRSLDSDEVTFN